MLKQRGFFGLGGVQLYVVAGLGIALVISILSGVALYYRSESSEADAKAARLDRDRYKAGLETSEAERLKEHKRAETLAAIGATHEQEKADLEKRRRADVAAARAGALKLRVANACPASNAGETSAAPGVGNDATTAELPREITEDLLGLANDADEVVTQLGACQNTIREYLK